MPHIIGYARVSSPSQNLDAQIDNLKGAGCARIFTDTISGTKTQRKGWTELMAYIRSGDVLVITELSRMSRSLSDLLEIVEDLKVRQVELKSLRESIDTSSATGRAFLSIMGAVSQMEGVNQVEGPLSDRISSNRHAFFTRTLINPPERFVPSSGSQGEHSSNISEKPNKIGMLRTKKPQIALQCLKRAC